jgi:hypothetical protein
VNSAELKYTPLEKLRISRPVDRIDFIRNLCSKKTVIDLGCFDESAKFKFGTKYWLHREISLVSEEVAGIDNTENLPVSGKRFFENEYMYKGDVNNFSDFVNKNKKYDIMVAGELIEHLPDTIQFLKKVKNDFKGEYLIITTPNATSLSNILLGMIRKESCNKDHYQIYSYKTLNTILSKSGFDEWVIFPYYVRFTEMILCSKGINRILIRMFEKTVNLFEFIFPMLSGGLIVKVKV